MDADIEVRVRQILTDRLGLAPETLSAEARLVEDLGMDSLDAVELSIAMERQFKITLSDDQMAKLKTVGDVMVLVQGLVAESGKP
jgi:acyl carrier protein